MTPIETNKPLFFNLDGEPLNGTIYIGQPDTDPRTNPKTVTFRDSGGSEFTASQPLTTINGRISYNGKPIVALVDGEYSLLSFDKFGAQVEYDKSIVSAGSGAGGIADFSEVTRVGLTLDEVKGFNVAVGDTVRNVGKTTATDGLGEDWLVISNTGNPANDAGLIDFSNGLQGRRINNGAVLVWEDGAGSTSVPMADLDIQDAGTYLLETLAYSFSIYVNPSVSVDQSGSCRAVALTGEMNVYYAKYDSGLSAFQVVQSRWTGSFAENTFQDIFFIYKV